MPKQFTVFADNKEIYKGSLTEVPEYLRNNLIEALTDWQDQLSKSGLNELVYSSLHWYTEKNFYCAKCDISSDINKTCEKCGSEMEEKFIHERDSEIDRLLDCIGMINRVEISDKENT